MRAALFWSSWDVPCTCKACLSYGALSVIPCSSWNRCSGWTNRQKRAWAWCCQRTQDLCATSISLWLIRPWMACSISMAGFIHSTTPLCTGRLITWSRIQFFCCSRSRVFWKLCHPQPLLQQPLLQQPLLLLPRQLPPQRHLNPLPPLQTRCSLVWYPFL